MDTQDILKSLSNLEHSLQGVESARQQVEKTVAAYDVAKNQLFNLAQEFGTVSTDLKSVVTVIKGNQVELGAIISARVEELLAMIGNKVAAMGNKASEISQKYKDSSQKSVETFNNKVDAAVSSFNVKVKEVLFEIASDLSAFKAGVDSVDTNFKNSSSDVVAKFENSLEHIFSTFNAKLEAQLKAFSNLKDELETIVNLQRKINAELLTKFEKETEAIKLSLTELDKQIKEIQNSNNEHHQELIEVLSAIVQGNNPSAEKVIARFNTVNGNIGTVKEGVSSVSSQLGTATSQIIDKNKQTILSEVTSVKAENAGIKKLVTFCLVATVLSVLLNVAVLLL